MLINFQSEVNPLVFLKFEIVKEKLLSFAIKVRLSIGKTRVFKISAQLKLI